MRAASSSCFALPEVQLSEFTDAFESVNDTNIELSSVSAPIFVSYIELSSASSPISASDSTLSIYSSRSFVASL
jgi:hypothetical protein